MYPQSMLEPPRRGGSNVYPTIYVLSKNKKNIKNFQLKIFSFQSSKNLCLLHGHVFVMLFIEGKVLRLETKALRGQRNFPLR